MNDYSYAAEGMGDLFAGALGAAAGAIWVISLLVSIFTLVCMWKCFVKMGEPGWASIIPIYNCFVLCAHTWGSGWMMLTWIVPFIGSIMTMITWFKFFERFGKSTFFNLLGMFLTPITLAICAFDNSEWIGA